MRAKSAPRLLSGEDKLAVLAAVADSPRAQTAWASLMGDVDFIDIARSTQRLTPLIYLNLREHSDLPERGRLRGAYKHAWSHNHKLLAGFAPIARAFDAEGINYRILKGMAVQLSLGIVGARVVGDVDFVIAQEDVSAARAILEDHGFRCNSVSRCGLHSSGAAHQALDFNRGDIHLDLHVAGLKEPSELIKAMLVEPAHKANYGGTTYLVPPAELLALHTAFHGSAHASETDFSQSVADLALLLPHCAITLLQRTADQLGVGQPLWSVGQAMNDLGIETLSFPSWRARRPTKPKSLLAGTKRGLRSTVSYAWMLWRQRFRQGKPLIAALRGFQGRRVSYFLWLLAGSFSSVEKKILARRRGFLQLPLVAPEPGTFFAPFENSSPAGVSASPVAAECNDYRFAFRCPAGVREWVMTIDGPGIDEVDVAVHHNGERLVRIVRGSSQRSLAVLNPPTGNEISIRPIAGSCEACAVNLSSLRFSLRFRLREGES